MFFRGFRLSAEHLKKVLPGFSTVQNSTPSLIAVGLLSLCGLCRTLRSNCIWIATPLFMQDYGGPVGFRMAWLIPKEFRR